MANVPTPGKVFVFGPGNSDAQDALLFSLLASMKRAGEHTIDVECEVVEDEPKLLEPPKDDGNFTPCN